MAGFPGAALLSEGGWVGGGRDGAVRDGNQMISFVIDLNLAYELLFQVSVQNAPLISQ